MDQLTQHLAETTCKLSVMLQAVQQQELLVEALRKKGWPTAGAEFLLEMFNSDVAAIFSYRQSLEEDVIRLARKAKPGIVKKARKARWAPNVYLLLTRAKENLFRYGIR